MKENNIPNNSNNNINKENKINNNENNNQKYKRYNITNVRINRNTIRKKKKKIHLKTLFLIGSILILIFLFIFFKFFYLADDKIMNNLKIEGITIGNLSKKEAINLLKKTYSKTKIPVITLSYANHIWKIKPIKISLNYNLSSSVEQAFKIGRQGSFWQKLKERGNSYVYPLNLNLKYTIDENKLVKILKNIQNRINVPARNAQLKNEKNHNYEIIPESTGIKMDIQDNKKLFLQMLEAKKNKLELKVKIITPIITKDSLNKKIAKIRKKELQKK